MSRMKEPMRTAMRFAVYVRSLGAEPLPFRHKTYEAYAVALQRQYEELLRTVEPAIAREARIAGRVLIRKRTLQVAAGDLFPTQQPPKVVKSPIPDPPAFAASMVEPGDVQPENACGGNGGAEASLPGPGLPTPNDIWTCRRKIRHFDYLSALKHASRLEDHDLHIYPCDVCMGLHVGHDPTRETFQKRKKLRKKLNMLARRLDVLEREKRQLEIQKLALIAEQTGF
jgi:hypothetical protein